MYNDYNKKMVKINNYKRSYNCCIRHFNEFCAQKSIYLFTKIYLSIYKEIKMKKLFAFILVAAMICATLALSVSATRGLVYNAPKGTPKIDGELDSVWDAAEWTDVDLPHGADTDTYGHSARAKVMWDETNLYLYAEITCPSTEEWNDTFEVYFDENNDKEAGYGGDDTQNGFWKDGVREGYGTNNRALFIEDCAVNVTATQLFVEAAIPYFELEPKGGETLGLEFMLNIEKADGTFVQALRWNVDTANGDPAPYMGTSAFGEMVLVDAAAETEPETMAETEPETVAETEPETVAETEPETTAETEPAVEPAEETVTTETTAPQTFDVVVVSAVAAVISACGYAVTKKRR